MTCFRVIDAQWHIGHQYEMLKFPFVQWTWLMQYKRPSLNYSIRGDISHLFQSAIDYEPGRYDVAILHLDQDCLLPAVWNHKKGVVYRDMDRVINDIPKIVIMHGSPFNPEQPAPFCTPEWMRDRLKEILGSNHLVVNSYEAAKQWGVGIPIIHGMDASEWHDLPKVPRVITTLSASGMDGYYGRQFLEAIRTELSDRSISLCHIGRDYIPATWRDYRNFVGQSLIYLNVTQAAPMPRARTEAMLSGCCIATTANHDASTFISNGKNGYLISNDPTEVAELIESLLLNPDRARDVGTRGKNTALGLFKWERFAQEWYRLLCTVTGKV